MKCDLNGDIRPFLSYSGVKLPLNLVEPLDGDQLKNRNTYFLGYFDEANRLKGVRKMVYADMEYEHRYHYDEAGRLSHITIINSEGDILELDGDEINTSRQACLSGDA